MTTWMKPWMAFLLVCICWAWCADGASSGPSGPPTVRLNGEPLAMEGGPPILVLGELLVPLEDLVGALGGEIVTDPLLPNVIVHHGETTVELVLDQTAYRVGERELDFAIAPVRIGRMIYVDAKDLVEALGGRMVWVEKYRTADLRIQWLSLGSRVARGTLVYLYSQPGAPPFFLIREEGKESLTGFMAEPELHVFQTEESKAPRPANLAAIRSGDYIALGLSEDNKVRRALVTRLVVSGKVERVAGGRLTLQDGQAFNLAPDVQVTREGTEIDLSRLRKGDVVQITANPADRTALLISVAQGGGSQPEETGEGPRILVVAPENYRGPVTNGGEIRVRLRGTPGGNASFDIGNKIKGVPLREQAPGNYVGKYTVTLGDDVNSVPIRGHLRVGGKDAADVDSQIRVTIDTVAPRFLQVSPGYNEAVDTASPTILVEYDDPGGTGVDPSKVTVKVGEEDVTQDATIEATQVSYRPRSLAPGEHWVTVVLADRAGNQRQLRTTFRVELQEANPIVSVQHDATRPLVAGDTLVVTMEVRNPGRAARFVIGDNWRTVAMSRIQGKNAYRGRYTVKPDDQVTGAAVTGHFTDGDGRNWQMAATMPLNIRGRVPNELTIGKPGNQEEISERNLVVAGEAPPNRQVRVLVRYSLPFFGEQTLARQTITSDDHGKWQTQPIDLEGDLGARLVNEFTITVQLLDDQEKVADQKRVPIRYGGKWK